MEKWCESDARHVALGDMPSPSNDGSWLQFEGGFDGHWNYWLLDVPTGVATRLTEGHGDNTFGGFLSLDDECLHNVKGDWRLLRLLLQTFTESVVYEVPEDLVGYSTGVANSVCSKVMYEIAARSYMPLTDWKRVSRVLLPASTLPATQHRPVGRLAHGD